MKKRIPLLTGSRSGVPAELRSGPRLLHCPPASAQHHGFRLCGEGLHLHRALEGLLLRRCGRLPQRMVGAQPMITRPPGPSNRLRTLGTLKRKPRTLRGLRSVHSPPKILFAFQHQRSKTTHHSNCERLGSKECEIWETLNQTDRTRKRVRVGRLPRKTTYKSELSPG